MQKQQSSTNCLTGPHNSRKSNHVVNPIFLFIHNGFISFEVTVTDMLPGMSCIVSFKKTREVLVPVNEILFGNRVFAVVIKL